jgi:hypothetical protein
MHTRTKQLWAMMTAMTLVVACLVPIAAANRTSNTRIATGVELVSDATTPALSAGQMQVANKVASPFVTMAGSHENAVALATALRTGTTANLVFASSSPSGNTTQKAIELAIPTKPMGWGSVSHAFALAQLSLRQAGIENPTAPQLQAALDGGSIKTADGKTVTLPGVLQQRAEGMGWGQIAKTYGTTMGALNRGLKAPATTVASSTPAKTTSSAPTQRRPVVTGTTHGRSANGVTTGTNSAMASYGSKALTTATGSHPSNSASGHSAKGITTAFGATAGGAPSMVSAAGNGQGKAFGRGVMTAAGGGASNAAGGTRGGGSSVLTGSGTNATGVRTAESASGGGKANGHGKSGG